MDNDWDEEKVGVTFGVKNKRDNTIEVQSHEVYADGKKVYGGDLPDMENDIDLTLYYMMILN